MTKLLDEVIADIRTLPEQDQNWAAENMRRLMRERERGASYQLTPEQVEEVAAVVAPVASVAGCVVLEHGPDVRRARCPCGSGRPALGR